MKNYFNPLGRKTETWQTLPKNCGQSDFNPLGRKTETDKLKKSPQTRIFQSTRSQDRDDTISDERVVVDISIHSVARPRPEAEKTEEQRYDISIHSVARPRRYDTINKEVIRLFQSTRSQDRDRKEPTFSQPTPEFQSTRSQDRDII